MMSRSTSYSNDGSVMIVDRLSVRCRGSWCERPEPRSSRIGTCVVHATPRTERVIRSKTGAMGDREYRIEHDTMGEVRVPADALWRAQTQRAVENFPISGRPLERAQIRALGLLKAAAARV